MEFSLSALMPIIVILFVAGAALFLYLLLASRLKPSQIGWQSLPTQTIDVNGWTIRYHKSGQGPTLLLIHGIGADLNCWKSIVTLLNPRFTVIALDLPGFGRSSKHGNEFYGLDEQAERVGGFLKALDLKSVFIVGSSMGANIGMWTALKFPEQTKGLVLLAPAADPSLVPGIFKHLTIFSRPAAWLIPRLGVRWLHLRTLTRKDRLTPFRVHETWTTYRGDYTAIRSFLLATSAIRDKRLLQKIRNLSVKVMVLWGAKDRLVPKRVISKLLEILPHAEIHIHEQGGHHLQEDEPEWLADKIAKFLIQSC